MKKIIIILIFIIFLISCGKVEESKEKTTTILECTLDSDCSTGGCSGQVCTTKEKVKGLITTCEWREEYNCLRLTSCSCINNKCQWEENDKYNNCISNFKKTI